MNRKQKIALVLEVCLPLLVSILAPVIQARMQPKQCGCEEKKPVKTYIVLGILGYAAFISLTILFVKLAWRWIL